MTTVYEFEPLVITATAPAKPAPIIYATTPTSAPPIFKVANAVNLLGAGILWWAGWHKVAAVLGGLSVIDIVARQVSPGYAKDTEQFYGWRR